MLAGSASSLLLSYMLLLSECDLGAATGLLGAVLEAPRASAPSSSPELKEISIMPGSSSARLFMLKEEREVKGVMEWRREGKYLHYRALLGARERRNAHQLQ